jgi:hypothetical protein
MTDTSTDSGETTGKEEAGQAASQEPDNLLKWIFRGVGELMLFPAVGMGILFGWSLYRHLTMPQPDVEAVRHAMDEIIAAQQRFLEGAFYDADGDGIPDYGSLRQLYNPAGDRSVAPLIGKELRNGRAHGYEFRMYVNPSGGRKRHGYWIIVDTIRRDARWAPIFHLDESGTIITIQGDTPCEDSGESPQG